MSVYQEPDMLTDVALTQAGEASFPLIGSVSLAGQTLKEAEQAITQLYNADYLVEPKLSINLVEASRSGSPCWGPWRSPENFPFRRTQFSISPRLSIGAAGSRPMPTSRGLRLKRGGETKIYTLKQLRAKGASQVELRHGDRINVASSPYAGKQVLVTGEVVNPGPVIFPAGGVLDLKTALGMAGGLGDRADANRITVRRGAQLFAATLKNGRAKLLPGDQISVPVSRFAGKTVTVMGTGGAAR